MSTTRATRVTTVANTEVTEIPLIGVPANRKYTTSGLKRMLGGLYWLLLVKRIDRTAGIPMSMLIPVTSLAITLAGAIFRNRKRSKIRPTAGARTTTAITKARPTGRCSFWTR